MGINNYISTAIVFKKCYKKKTCAEGGYYSYEPASQNCSTKNYNGYTCYYSCSYKTCSDYGYEASIPSGQKCRPIEPRDGLRCYTDCENNKPIYFAPQISIFDHVEYYGQGRVIELSISGGTAHQSLEMHVEITTHAKGEYSDWYNGCGPDTESSRYYHITIPNGSSSVTKYFEVSDRVYKAKITSVGGFYDDCTNVSGGCVKDYKYPLSRGGYTYDVSTTHVNETVTKPLIIEDNCTGGTESQCVIKANALQAEIDNFNDTVSDPSHLEFCDSGCDCGNYSIIRDCEGIRSELIERMNKHNSECPNDTVGGFVYHCTGGGLCSPGGWGACYHCVK